MQPPNSQRIRESEPEAELEEVGWLESAGTGSSDMSRASELPGSVLCRVESVVISVVPSSPVILCAGESVESSERIGSPDEVEALGSRGLRCSKSEPSTGTNTGLLWESNKSCGLTN